VQVFITPGVDGIKDGSAAFEIDGSAQFTLQDTALWQQKTYFLTGGSHSLEWTAFHANSASDDQVQLFLDDVVITYNAMPVLRLVDGTEGMGKVLVSDEHGNAGWVSLSSITEFANAGSNGLLPLVLNGNHQHTNVLTVLDANGSGIQSNSNSDHGFAASNNGGYGFLSENSGLSGFKADNAGVYGFASVDSDNDGFISIRAGDDGFTSSIAIDDGFVSSSAGDDGFVSSSAGNDGFYSINSGGDGFESSNAGNDGFVSTSAGDNGFYSSFANDDGFVSFNAGDDGFVSTSADDTGFQSNSAGSIGFWSSSSNGDGFLSTGSVGDEGYFDGTVTVTGMLSKPAGSFKIDHPLDPENKLLYHSFVESPDMMNVYNGNIILDAQGEATIILPDYFEVLNKDFRYQLTCVGGYAQIFISEKLNNNQFKIAGGNPGLEVSWQITGIRQDPYANQHRIEVEVEKEEKFKGQYLHYEAYNKPFKKSFTYVKLGYKTLEELKEENRRPDESK
jgi:hypothetical protein